MIVQLGFAVERMPTDGLGGSVAALGTGSTVISAVTDTTISLGGALAGIVFGTLITTSDGHWAIAQAAPAGAVVTIDYWRKRGAKTSLRNDGTRVGASIPTTAATYKAWVGAGIMTREGGWRIKNYALSTSAAATCTVQSACGGPSYALPLNVAGYCVGNFEVGLEFDSPFTFTPSANTVLGHLEFLEANR